MTQLQSIVKREAEGARSNEEDSSYEIRFTRCASRGPLYASRERDDTFRGLTTCPLPALEGEGKGVLPTRFPEEHCSCSPLCLAWR